LRNSLLIDYLAFGSQIDDISYGRETDGGTAWIAYIVSTPGYSNTLTAIQGLGSADESLIVYPNPVQYGVMHFNKVISVRLYDMTGRMWKESRDVQELDVHDVPPGIYILKSGAGEMAKIVKQ